MACGAWVSSAFRMPRCTCRRMKVSWRGLITATQTEMACQSTTALGTEWAPGTTSTISEQNLLNRLLKKIHVPTHLHHGDSSEVDERERDGEVRIERKRREGLHGCPSNSHLGLTIVCKKNNYCIGTKCILTAPSCKVYAPECVGVRASTGLGQRRDCFPSNPSPERE